jgi:hypothetical protein
MQALIDLEQASLDLVVQGWMSWEVFRCQTNCEAHPNSCVNEQLYTQMADTLVADGYLAAGYTTVSIDDCWEDLAGRENGALVPDPKRFPSGMKALGDHMHSKGVSFGIVSGCMMSSNSQFVDSPTFCVLVLRRRHAHLWRLSRKRGVRRHRC